MIYTARQLEDLWKANGSNGQLVLPYRARLSPLAADWVKAKKITLGYSDNGAAGPSPTTPALTPALSPREREGGTPGYVWWCEGPCGTAKAALMTQAKEVGLAEAPVAGDARKLVEAIKHLAAEVRAGRASGGILFVSAGAAALVYANRCPSLRAVVGTCLETVEQGIRSVAANVLVIEHPHKTLNQIRNMLSRFTKARRELSDETRAALGEMATCG